MTARGRSVSIPTYIGVEYFTPQKHELKVLGKLVRTLFFCFFQILLGFCRQLFEFFLEEREFLGNHLVRLDRMILAVRIRLQALCNIAGGHDNGGGGGSQLIALATIKEDGRLSRFKDTFVGECLMANLFFLKRRGKFAQSQRKHVRFGFFSLLRGTSWKNYVSLTAGMDQSYIVTKCHVVIGHRRFGGMDQTLPNTLVPISQKFNHPQEIRSTVHARIALLWVRACVVRIFFLRFHCEHERVVRSVVSSGIHFPPHFLSFLRLRTLSVSLSLSPSISDSSCSHRSCKPIILVNRSIVTQ